MDQNKHYNKYLQNAYNKYDKKYTYKIIFSNQNISNEELSDIEMFFIDKFGTYKNGYNLTLGGEGGSGITLTDEERLNRSIRATGEKNPQSKLSNKQFFEIVEMLKLGFTNSEISEIYGVHDRYVSLIRHKKRFKSLWDDVIDYIPVNSNGNAHTHGKVTEEMFIEIVNMIEEGCSNAEIERMFSLSSGTGSRIRHKKIYKIWWNKYFREDLQEGSTTIETDLIN